ncbi:caspase family protein [Winogradskyella sp.]|jgi:hypothetical protein|uniref:caspase family protein n=1 Tax=Winogradskyella sp. TaxID=1883156 RepID=UPI0025EF86A8|nr:caspase family protein [Winogradskyella sp.]MCT4628811.1 caspase family protein [Winogradskyella sp.]
MKKINSNQNDMRRALIVGINHYDRSPLDGCINDAMHMYEVLSRNDDDSVNFDCKLLVSEENSRNKITVTRLKKEIFNLLQQEAEIAVLYFSGHGAATDIGSYLVTQDARKYLEGVSLDEVIALANSSKVREVILILDCCHSGHLGNIKGIGYRKALLREGVSILTSSRDTQYSMENSDGQGVFTSIIYQALRGGGADILGNVNVSRVYNYVDQLLNTWEQRPIFKSHVSKMVTIRKCKPKIEFSVLRKLIEYFTKSDTKYILDNSYERSLGSNNETNIKVMEYLREYYSLGLLKVNGVKYLYQAARDNKSCELTSLGQYFWRMVKNNRI